LYFYSDYVKIIAIFEGGFMKKIIIIKYGELSTKKDNINYFLKVLKENIDFQLAHIDHTIKYDHGRMLIFAKEEDLDSIFNKLKTVFGIHEIINGYLLNNQDEKQIFNEVLNLVKEQKFNTFKVETKRSDKDYPITSMEFSKQLGGFILKNIKNIKVDVHNPELMINVEIRKSGTLIYTKGLIVSGGYPVATLGKGLLMLSGGIDSPVAGYMAMKRGIKIEAIYYESPPHTSQEAKNKVFDLAKVLASYNMNINVHVINFTKIQEEILKNIPNEYLITIMRRMMYRIAEKIALRKNCKVLVNGESIGQVASQTLTSIGVINEVVKIPVIRPVACFDKLEIIDLAKKIGTYDISIRPYEDCCTVFVPEHPIINPVLEKCIEYEKLIPYEDYIKEAIKNEEIIKISTDTKNNQFQDLL
jgi:thiamine biosynthesis protein ThiI